MRSPSRAVTRSGWFAHSTFRCHVGPDQGTEPRSRATQEVVENAVVCWAVMSACSPSAVVPSAVARHDNMHAGAGKYVGEPNGACRPVPRGDWVRLRKR